MREAQARPWNKYEDGPEAPEPRQRVIFRKWKRTGTVIAILPDAPANPGCCMMYEHVGQHGEGSYPGLVDRTTPAQPDEYADLLAELESIGYRLRIVKRLNYPRA